MPTTSSSASTLASAHTNRPPARTTLASARNRSTFFAFTGRMNRAKMSIVVIALFYSRGLDGWWLLGALLVTLVVVAMSRLGVDHPLLYVVPGVVLWWCLHEAGVEPTLASGTKMTRDT